MQTTTKDQIKQHIETFVDELDALVRLNTLQSIHDALDAPARRQRQAPKAEGLPSRITSHVAAHPGQTVGQIVAALGAKSPTAKKAILGLLASKAIRKAGEKRGTRYYPAGAGPLPGARSKPKRRAKPTKKPGRKSRTSRAKATLVPARRRDASPRAASAQMTDVPLALAIA